MQTVHITFRSLFAKYYIQIFAFCLWSSFQLIENPTICDQNLVLVSMYKLSAPMYNSLATLNTSLEGKFCSRKNSLTYIITLFLSICESTSSQPWHQSILGIRIKILMSSSLNVLMAESYYINCFIILFLLFYFISIKKRIPLCSCPWLVQVWPPMFITNQPAIQTVQPKTDMNLFS